MRGIDSIQNSMIRQILTGTGTANHFANSNVQFSIALKGKTATTKAK